MKGSAAMTRVVIDEFSVKYRAAIEPRILFEDVMQQY